jgi:hypothetical protein
MTAPPLTDMIEATGNDLPNLHQWLPLLRESLTQQGRFRWQLHGASMLPTLPPGSEIEIESPPSRIPLGTLVVFAGSASLVVHRLVHRAPPFLVTQGDNRREPDRWLRSDQVLGVVVSAHRDGRRIWPGALDPALRWRWIGRAWGLWLLRRLKRIVTQ